MSAIDLRKIVDVSDCIFNPPMSRVKPRRLLYPSASRSWSTLATTRTMSSMVSTFVIPHSKTRFYLPTATDQQVSKVLFMRPVGSSWWTMRSTTPVFFDRAT